MDIKLENKDIVLRDNGSALMIEGIEQVLQQIMIGASVKKGSFIYDRNMGASVDDVNLADNNASKVIESILNESLINIAEISVKVNYLKIIDEGILVGLTITDGYTSKETEVTIYE